MSTVTIQLNDREHATVLAALRIYQQRVNMNGGQPPGDVADIADNAGTVEPLTDAEIDTLCEDINCGETQEPSAATKIVVTVNGGCVTAVHAADLATQVQIIDWDNINDADNEDGTNEETGDQDKDE